MFLLAATLLAVSSAAHATPSVWPVPKIFSADGPPMLIAPNFSITGDYPSGGPEDEAARYFADAMERYTAIVKATKARDGATESTTPANAVDVDASPASLHRLHVKVKSSGPGIPGPETASNYTISIDINSATPLEGIATAEAETVYGAIYALETFSQLVFAAIPTDQLLLQHSRYNITDEPQFSWRGLLIDPGRRFFPIPLLHNLLDTMSFVKMNVLHIHASDYCRWSIESKHYPHLAVAQQGIPGGEGYYSQADVKELITYAASRGIRVVPEFDLPGHARGLLPLEADGLQFCDAKQAWRNQIQFTQKSVGVLHKLLQEMSELFPDPFFNLGTDVSRFIDVSSNHSQMFPLLLALCANGHYVPDHSCFEHNTNPIYAAN